ncbi:MAG: hypothetical protein IJM30_03310 [Thermoguttaceae bacterium]|nr:hypothetical protein [Thermoguttaceae bacterium]
MKYCLTHHCGRSYPVEPRQAGQQIDCECGEKIQIPTLLKMKRLPEWNDEGAESPIAEVVTNPADASVETAPANEPPKAAARVESSAPKKTRSISPTRLGLFIVAGIIFVIGVFIICRNYRKPQPLSVYSRNTWYTLEDGRSIKRDSTQTTPMDNGFYWTWDDQDRAYLVTDEMIDKGFSYFGAYQYFQYVRDLDLSDNFYDNYNGILTRWKLWLAGWGILVFVSLTVALLALFLKESNKQVGTMRGEGWR